MARTDRVHTDVCARCGCDRKEQRRGKFRCKAYGVLYSSHIWGWEDEDHGKPGHFCGSCNPQTIPQSPAKLGTELGTLPPFR